MDKIDMVIGLKLKGMNIVLEEEEARQLYWKLKSIFDSNPYYYRSPAWWTTDDIGITIGTPTVTTAGTTAISSSNVSSTVILPEESSYFTLT